MWPFRPGPCRAMSRLARLSSAATWDGPHTTAHVTLSTGGSVPGRRCQLSPRSALA